MYRTSRIDMEVQKVQQISLTRFNFFVRYELVMDFYNNPAKPCTPPLTLIWDIYWLIKKILLQVIPITTALSTKKESLSRTFNSVRFQIFKRKL